MHPYDRLERRDARPGHDPLTKERERFFERRFVLPPRMLVNLPGASADSPNPSGFAGAASAWAGWHRLRGQICFRRRIGVEKNTRAQPAASYVWREQKSAA